IGSTKDCEITAMANEEKKFYGLQFHPEVDHSTQGGKIIENFVLNICESEKNWEIKDIVNHLITKIQKQAESKKVFVLVSGGVDSNVAFSLLTKALGEDRVKGLYIDTGFMRYKESEEIMENFKKAGFNNLEIEDASEIFFKRLEGIFEPEEKRHIIGQTFLDVKESVSEKLGLDPEHWMLGQGTIYPDTIESGDTKNSDKIKTHHNRVDAITKLIEKGMVIEPLIDFYKYEVRKVGELLALPQELIDRHPFPGPGLAIRCLCHKSSEKEDVDKGKEKIANILSGINHSLLSIKSVGVQGDNRTYAHPLVVWGEKDWDKLDDLSVTTTNNVREVNRMILLLNPKEKNIFEIPKKDLFLTKERIETLKVIDNIVSENVKTSGLYDEIWQFPVVLLPVTDGSDKESIVLRPVNTRDAMTLDFFRMPQDVIEKIVKEIEATGKISHIFYDITNKPPGTTEWE
ncbi:MAG: glutamine-hydrolyzing GMP synthase, partial [Candidatus Moranbacteria bacterium]|nr:glutamine-hydrolyzing GMP synthase [Candidatus Moranbacteria bacterium]